MDGVAVRLAHDCSSLLPGTLLISTQPIDRYQHRKLEVPEQLRDGTWNHNSNPGTQVSCVYLYTVP